MPHWPNTGDGVLNDHSNPARRVCWLEKLWSLGQARGARRRTNSWLYCWIFPPKNYCRKTGHKVKVCITEQGIPSEAKTNTSRKKGKPGPLSLTRLPSKMLVVGSCFNNDSLNWWQCSLELSLWSGCFMFHKTSSEEKEGHCHGEGCGWMLSSRANTFLIYKCLRSAFKDIMLYLSKSSPLIIK